MMGRVLCAEDAGVTAGLDMPRWFGPAATATPLPGDRIDPMGLRNQCRKPVITAVQGIRFTIGLAPMLCDAFSAPEAHRIGLVQAVVAPGRRVPGPLKPAAALPIMAIR